jgi:hypothetical protein
MIDMDSGFGGSNSIPSEVERSIDFPNDLSANDEAFIEDWVEGNSDPYVKYDFKEAIVAFLKHRAGDTGVPSPPPMPQ